MAVSVKGITINIGANTQALTTSLQSVNKQVMNTSKDLKEVNRLLKFNPRSTELLSQKQKMLTNAIGQTKAKIETLKQARDQLAKKGDKRTAEEEKQYRRINRAIIEQEGLLKSYQAQLTQMTSVGIARIQALGVKFQQLGASMVAIGNKMRYMSMLIGGGLIASTKSAITFEDSFKKVKTLTDTNVTSFDEMKSAIMDLSNQTGISASEISDSVYQALSASVDTKDVIAFTKEATNLAKTGFTSTSDAVDVLTTIINAYGMEAKDVNRISGVLIQTQNDGKTTVDQLAKSMGKVIPTAKAFGVNIENLGASYSIMTRNGTSTREATTQINRVLSELGKEGSDVSAILKDRTGKSFSELMKDGKSLGDVMQILQDSVGGNSDKFFNLWKSQVAGKGALAMLSEGTKGYNEELKKMQDSAKNVQKNLERIQNATIPLRKAWNQLKNVALLLGEAMLSTLAPVFEKMSSLMERLYKWFDSLSEGQKKVIVTILLLLTAISPVLIVLGKIIGIIGTVMASIGTIISFVSALSGVLTALIPVLVGVLAPIMPIIVAVGLLVALGVMLYKNWDEVKKRAKGLIEAFNIIKKGFVDKTTQAFTNLKTNITNAVTGILTKFQNFKSKVAQTFSNIKDKIVNPFKTAFDKIKGFRIGKVFGDIKLPHIHIEGGKAPYGLGGKGKKPVFRVEWHANAMQLGRILSGATIFGQDASGNLLGGGETGREVVVGQNSLLSMISNSMRANSLNLADSIVNGLTASLSGVGGSNAPITIQVQMYPTGQVFEREIVNAYDRGKAKGY